jgi:hypothetical protein
MHYGRWVRHKNHHINLKKRPLIDIFNERHIPVPEAGCWIWTGGILGKNSYGVMTKDSKKVWAHRFAYEHFVGPIPEGMLVLHKCDTPLCVNPHHLFIGTNRDNVLDSIKKGRRPCVIKATELQQVLDLHKYGFSRKEISEMYGSGVTAIDKIITKKRSEFKINNELS